MTRKSIALAAAFIALAVVALAGLGYVSLTALRLESERARTAREAALEENVRLALWRIDSYLSTVVALENAQPAEAFNAASRPKDYVLARFLADPFPSEQSDYPSGKNLLAALEMTRPAATPPGHSPRAQSLSQVARNEAEFYNRFNQNIESNVGVQSLAGENPPLGNSGVGPGVGLLRPVWLGQKLYLVRSTAGGVQAVALDWSRLSAEMMTRITDLLPGARLVPFTGGRIVPGRTLSALPVTIVPGEVPPPTSGRSAVTTTLSFAWAAAVAALAAIAALLGASITLSERRAAFVSAVTHELRTPLTTLKLYTEMLSTGMVPDERRADYLETLRLESDRLGHLVENVLAFSRLEGRRRAPLEAVNIVAAIDRSSARLSELAQRAGLALEISAPADVAGVRVWADPAALERVLVNLVDNAAKYGADATRPVIQLELSREQDLALIRVRDFGPGVSPSVRDRLFRPFSRSASEAAGSAPGVGLGLALSRRLARGMGGDLLLESAHPPGATFALRLNISPE